MLDTLQGKTIQLQGSVRGFEHLNIFTLHVIEEAVQFAYLQSLEEEGVGFVVASPFELVGEYTFEIEEVDKGKISLTRHEDALVLSILTLKEPFIHSTVNLLAPIIINVSNMQGLQIVLPPKYDYGTKTPISKHLRTESRGDS